MRLLQNTAVRAIITQKFDLGVLQSAYSRLYDLNDPMRCNLFALLIREVIRVAISRLSPDEEVKKTSWFIGDKGTVTRRCRYRFAITGYLSDSVLTAHPQLSAENEISELVNAIGKLSKYAHLSENTYALPLDKVEEFRNNVEDAVIEFAEALVRKKEELAKITLDLTHEEVEESLRSHLPSELAALSCKTTINGIELLKLQDFNTSVSSPILSGDAIVDVGLADFEKDEAYGCDAAYGFQFHVYVDPSNLAIEIASLDFNLDERLEPK
jgi:Predicted pPIWI-associating nuclease